MGVSWVERRRKEWLSFDFTMRSLSPHESFRHVRASVHGLNVLCVDGRHFVSDWGQIAVSHGDQIEAPDISKAFRQQPKLPGELRVLT
jgi:hypothetical protein